MANIFITGAKSFVGRRLIKKLSCTDHNLINIDIISKEDEDNYINADICNPNIGDLIPENSIIIHLAAISKPPLCQENPKLAFDVNVNGTINLFEASKKRNAKNFIFSSSEWVYDKKLKDNKLFNENSLIDIFDIDSVLPFTKLVAEQYLKIHKSDIPVNILRLGIIYGPSETEKLNWSAVDYIFHEIKYKNLVEIGSINTARCFIHIDDIVEGIISVINKTTTDTYNISGNELISLKEIINFSSKILNKNPEIIEKNPQGANIRGASNKHALKNLNWLPKINLEQGLITINDFLNKQTQYND